MIPHTPLSSTTSSRQIEVCEECDADCASRIDLIKHYRDEHGYTMAAATELASKFAGPPGT